MYPITSTTSHLQGVEEMAQDRRTESQQKNPNVRADYNSPTGRKSFLHQLPILKPQHSTEEKTEYLAAVRSRLPVLQEQINHFLTQKMEEDNSKGGRIHKLLQEQDCG